MRGIFDTLIPERSRNICLILILMIDWIPTYSSVSLLLSPVTLALNPIKLPLGSIKDFRYRAKVIYNSFQIFFGPFMGSPLVFGFTVFVPFYERCFGFCLNFLRFFDFESQLAVFGIGAKT